MIRVAVVAALLFGLTACAPPPPLAGLKSCPWRGSIIVNASYRNPGGDRTVAARVGNHSLWDSVGADPDCLGIAIINMRKGSSAAPFNQCYGNPRIRATKLWHCTATIRSDTDGIEWAERYMTGYYTTADYGTRFSLQGSAWQYAKGGTRRPSMTCTLWGTFPPGTWITCPWVVAVPGRGLESGVGGG